MTHAVAIPAIQQRIGARVVAVFVAAGMAACVRGRAVVARIARKLERAFAPYTAGDRREWQFGGNNMLPQKWFRRTFAGDRPM